MPRFSVLFVCLGNICRSPTAEGIFKHKLSQTELGELVFVDSAGTSAHHVDETPDPRAQEEAKKAGYDLSFIRSRQVRDVDFHEFDLIVAMDDSNYYNLKDLAPDPEYHDKIKLFLADYAPDLPKREVPDPYYGGKQGFVEVIQLIEAASDGLIEELRRIHNK
ncbi:low molecular weight protein-tyrosine-phosphatase [Kangiella koreensis]|uniref:protein-tyrosine-phosphatase n=1 Tax=Kangiella koreensis (strain DSM 16069 / JCM 12317 / KCTC 12182 / SW-125) TaxID=523791 RepID=C7RBZ2_KANKD|nr:low molecular weight protein-tyrosine-phosphatase [Kangiella koreensis]ACV26784.1 protein tyrosine phosphatase [Kangiella koreensis DSM 16069]